MKYRSLSPQLLRGKQFSVFHTNCHRNIYCLHHTHVLNSRRLQSYASDGWIIRGWEPWRAKYQNLTAKAGSMMDRPPISEGGNFIATQISHFGNLIVSGRCVWEFICWRIGIVNQCKRASTWENLVHWQHGKTNELHFDLFSMTARSIYGIVDWVDHEKALE